MPKIKAALAAVLVMEKEGITQTFGEPGAAINPLYAQLRERGSIAHVLARHVEAASPMAEGGAFFRSTPDQPRPDLQIHFVVGIVDQHMRRLHLAAEAGAEAAPPA